MRLQSDGIYVFFVEIIVNNGWNRIPVATHFIRAKGTVQCQACVSLYANISFVRAPINNNRLNDAAIRDDRLLEFAESRPTLRLFVFAAGAQRDKHLLRSWVAFIHLQEFRNSRIADVELNVVYGKKLVLANRFHRVGS
jgi:hypothetical protein